jgi:hypothetical protein
LCYEYLIYTYIHKHTYITYECGMDEMAAGLRDNMRGDNL